MLRIVDEHGAVVAAMDGEGRIHGTAPRALAWLRDGVPALAPKKLAKGISEERVVVPPTDPLYNLALAEACENAGWALEDDEMAKSQTHKRQADEAADLLRAAGPYPQVAGTDAEGRKPAAASPPPAPPPVARPHHHQDALQLPTKPTKKFPPPSHRKPTKAPRKLMETPPELTKSQRHEADALLKAAGVDASEPKPKRKAAAKSDPAALTKNHERMQKLHTKAADEAADRGDGALSKLHADAAAAHTAAAHAQGAGLPEAGALTKKAADATRTTLPQPTEGKGNAKQTTSAQTEAQGKVASGAVTEKPNAGAQAAGVGGRSKEGLKVIAIGPKGGKIVGYTTKDGKQKAIYEGSKAASKLAATVATHADPAKAEPEAEDAAAPAEAAPSTPAAEAKAGGEPPADSADAEKPDDAAAADAPQDATAGDQAAAPAPAAPSELIDDKPLSPDEPAGGTPSDAPDPEQLGSASPKTDSPESRHADEIAKMRAQVEDAHKKLAALAHHIDANLVPMFNNLKSQARAAHRNPNPSVVGWLLAQIGRFASFVLGLHEDKGKVTSAADAMNGGPKDSDGKTPAERQAQSDGANGHPLRAGATEGEKKAHAAGAAHAAKPAPKAKLPQARVIEKSLTASDAAGLEGACVDLLSTLQAIERLEHSAHLQAQGPEFYADHLLFGRLYEGVQDEIDGLSEKMVATFGPDVVDADARAADAAELLARWEAGDGDALGRALAAELELQAAIAGALAAGGLSPGLENFLQGLADDHETAIYLLQRRLRPAVAKSMRATTSRQAYEADALLKSATGERVEVEIPAWMGATLLGLHKGAGHKYIRRIPKQGGGYRYFYKVSGGAGGVGHESEFEVGAAFRLKDAGQDGHFHITGKAADGTLTVKHDETGTTHTLSPAALRSMLHAEHAEAISAHRAKLARDIADAKAAGASPKQIARLEAEAKKHGAGVKVPNHDDIRAFRAGLPESVRPHFDAAHREALKSGKWREDASALDPVRGASHADIASSATAEWLDKRTEGRPWNYYAHGNGPLRDVPDSVVQEVAKRDDDIGRIAESEAHDRRIEVQGPSHRESARFAEEGRARAQAEREKSEAAQAKEAADRAARVAKNKADAEKSAAAEKEARLTFDHATGALKHFGVREVPHRPGSYQVVQKMNGQDVPAVGIVTPGGTKKAALHVARIFEHEREVNGGRLRKETAERLEMIGRLGEDKDFSARLDNNGLPKAVQKSIASEAAALLKSANALG